MCNVKNNFRFVHSIGFSAFLLMGYCGLRNCAKGRKAVMNKHGIWLNIFVFWCAKRL